VTIGGQIITASIANEPADELKLEKGKTAYAIIKATTSWWAWTNRVVPMCGLIACFLRE
jgi:hypothetical protein